LYNKKVKSIAIFRALQLGDMLCVIPAVRAIKTAFPNSSITLIGLAWEKDFVKRFSHYFDDFIEFPGWPGLPEKEYVSSDILQFLMDMQHRAFDLVLQMQGNGSIVNPMCMLFGARRVAGLRKEDDFSSDPKLFPIMTEDEHEIKRFLKVAEAIGAPTCGTDLEFPILPDELKNFERIKSILHLSDYNYICIHPGARDVRRRWSTENFAFVADALSSHGAQIVLTGSESESELLQSVQNQMAYPVANLVEKCGHVGVGELGALIAHSSGLISNDTGVSHIASALHIPSVIIFSHYSDPERWKPLNEDLHKVILPDKADDRNSVLRVVFQQLVNASLSVI
jgi:ADP-heptose:LPS heptosyltransferase